MSVCEWARYRSSLSATLPLAESVECAVACHSCRANDCQREKVIRRETGPSFHRHRPFHRLHKNCTFRPTYFTSLSFHWGGRYSLSFRKGTGDVVAEMQLPSSDSISPVLQQPVIERINRLSGRFHRDQIQRFYLVMGSASGNAAFSVIRLIDLCVYPPPPPSRYAT